jgi:hypothetical protein
VLTPYARAMLDRHTPELRTVFNTYGSIGAGRRADAFDGVSAQETIAVDDALRPFGDAGLLVDGRLSAQQLVAMIAATRAGQDPVVDFDGAQALQLTFEGFCEFVARVGYADLRRQEANAAGAIVQVALPASAQRGGGVPSGSKVDQEGGGAAPLPGGSVRLPLEECDDLASEAHALAGRHFAHELERWVGAALLAPVIPRLQDMADEYAIRMYARQTKHAQLNVTAGLAERFTPVDLSIMPPPDEPVMVGAGAAVAV